MSWEGGVKRSWDGLVEDEQGHLRDISAKDPTEARRQPSSAVQRGMLRFLTVVVDLSASMGDRDNDFRPNRAAATRELLSHFLSQFFSENPLGQAGIIVLREGRAKKICDFSSNIKTHLEALTECDSPSGDPSLQNALEMACGLLHEVPEYGHREVLVLFGSLTTKDPGDIFATLDKVRRLHIRASVIGLAAEVHVLRILTEKTGGSCGVATCVEHMKRLLAVHLAPPATWKGGDTPFQAEMVEMGFPRREQMLTSTCYDIHTTLNLVAGRPCLICPRCETRASEVPSVCAVCALPLVSAPHLAQSYHHLFPLPRFSPFILLPADAAASARTTATMTCFGCDVLFNVAEAEQYQCPGCQCLFCFDCDVFLHENLHNCPSCADVDR